ncbi:hypothetical protein DENSPDRAFT_517182 [Dentipellis sp. KUC8613]|nr:hypothetical protein DENSPDRAFT_517182 [Dentipellis sp. KUC8613]
MLATVIFGAFSGAVGVSIALVSFLLWLRPQKMLERAGGALETFKRQVLLAREGGIDTRDFQAKETQYQESFVNLCSIVSSPGQDGQSFVWKAYNTAKENFFYRTYALQCDIEDSIIKVKVRMYSWGRAPTGQRNPREPQLEGGKHSPFSLYAFSTMKQTLASLWQDLTDGEYFLSSP